MDKTQKTIVKFRVVDGAYTGQEIAGLGTFSRMSKNFSQPKYRHPLRGYGAAVRELMKAITLRTGKVLTEFDRHWLALEKVQIDSDGNETVMCYMHVFVQDKLDGFYWTPAPTMGRSLTGRR